MFKFWSKGNQISEKTKDIERLKSDFLSIISHELYTPLTPIKDSIEQLMTDKGLSETSRQLVEIIDRQVERMQSLIDDLMDLSQIEIEEWELHKEVIDLKELAEHKLADFKPKAHSKNIDLELKIKGELPKLRLDKKRIGHALKILLDNAIKFTPEDGRVSLQLYRISDGIEIAIEDTGIGLSKDSIDKIFDSFYQVEDHLTRKKGGTGVGLTIAKRIVEAHNGYIWAESQGMGAGSRFIFLLPES